MVHPNSRLDRAAAVSVSWGDSDAHRKPAGHIQGKCDPGPPLNKSWTDRRMIMTT